MGRLIKGHIFYHHTMSDSTDLILMKVGGLIRVASWHLTFLIIIGWMGTLQYNKRSRFHDLKGHNCHSSQSEFDEMLKDAATCSLMAQGIFLLFMRYSMFTYIAVQTFYFSFYLLLFKYHFWHLLICQLLYKLFLSLLFFFFFFSRYTPAARLSEVVYDSTLVTFTYDDASGTVKTIHLTHNGFISSIRYRQTGTTQARMHAKHTSSRTF